MDFALQCAWLLDAYIIDQMRVSKAPNAAVCLRFDILYEKYKPRICSVPTLSNGAATAHSHFAEEEEVDENGMQLNGREDQHRTSRTNPVEAQLSAQSSSDQSGSVAYTKVFSRTVKSSSMAACFRKLASDEQ